MAKPLNHQAYISSFPATTQALLQLMQQTIIYIAPNAIPVISYSMPAYKLNGKILVWFAGYDRHIGFYPGATAIAAFKNEIAVYKNAKGSVQFPLTQPLPVALITQMLQFKINENALKAVRKSKSIAQRNNSPALQ